MSCQECAGRSLVAPCPLCAVDEPETVMDPAEAGRYARECCLPRESNPWINPIDLSARLLWFEGWDGPDLEDGDDTAPDHNPDEITDPFDCLSLAQVAERLESFTQTAVLQFAILKHDLRGMTAMPPSMNLYVETLRLCDALQANLKRRAA